MENGHYRRVGEDEGITIELATTTTDSNKSEEGNGQQQEEQPAEVQQPKPAPRLQLAKELVEIKPLLASAVADEGEPKTKRQKERRPASSSGTGGAKRAIMNSLSRSQNQHRRNGKAETPAAGTATIHHNKLHKNGNGLPKTVDSPRYTNNTDTTETSLTIPADLQTNPDKQRLPPEAYCCCGAVQLRHTAIGIASVELLIFGYHLITNIVDLFLPPASANDPTVPAHLQHHSTVTDMLSLLSVLLAIIAVVLLLLGTLRRSPYMLLPHILMQVAMLTATLLIAIYVAFWLFGGINLHVSTLFFSQQANDTQIFERATQKTPIEAHFMITHMQIVLGVFLLLLLIAFFFQLWLFYCVLNTFQYLHTFGFDKTKRMLPHASQLFKREAPPI